MRGTWIILLIMVAAGVGMYFWFGSRKPKSAHHDTIVFKNTPDSIINKMKVYLADDPKEVMYLDSVWMQQDSTPLKQVLNGVTEDTMPKAYSNLTLFLAYDHHSFYDLELKKPDPKIAYTINLEIEPENGDTLMLTGTIIPDKGDGFQFKSPMMKIYRRFVVTYNHKLPEQPVDSTAIKGHDANKTITILKN